MSVGNQPCGRHNDGYFMYCYSEDDFMKAWGRLLERSAYDDYAEHVSMRETSRYPGRTRDNSPPPAPFQEH